MKKFSALIMALLLFTLCGCKNATDYVSDFTGLVKEKAENTYSIVLDKAEQIGEDIYYSLFDKVHSDRYEVVTVEPFEIDGNGLLAYNKLNSNQKKLYSIFIRAFEDMQLKKIDITSYAGDDVFKDASVAHKAVLCDRPDMFWAPKLFSLLTFESAKDTYIQFSSDAGESYFGITKAQKESMQAELNAVTDKIMSDVDKLNSTFEKELYIHDYLCEHITYDSAAAEDIENADADALSAYGALVKGNCVCEGYSKAFQLLCMKSGIPCSVVYGVQENIPHMWNIVSVDNQTYYVDVTFDDSSAVSILHSYFNVTKADALKDRTFYDEFSQSKEISTSDAVNFFCDNCESTVYNYFVKKGLVITEDCSYAIDALLNEKQAGKTIAELKNYTDRSLEDAFMLLRHKVKSEIKLTHYYISERSNTIIVAWQN